MQTVTSRNIHDPLPFFTTVETGQNLYSRCCIVISLQKQLIHMIASHDCLCSHAESCGLTQNAHARFVESRGVASQCVRVRLCRDLVSGRKFNSAGGQTANRR